MVVVVVVAVAVAVVASYREDLVIQKILIGKIY